MTLSRSNRIAAAVLCVALLAVLSGCGKPQYCSDRSSLQQSVKDLRNVKPLQSGGVQQLKSQLQQVEKNTQAVAGSAKKDFPSQTNALQTSVASLKSALQRLPKSPSPQQLSEVAASAKGVVAASQGFDNATDSKCS